MINNSIFRKYFLVLAGIFSLVIVFAFMASMLVSRMAMESERRGRPMDFFIKLLQREQGSPTEKVAQLNKLAEDDGMLHFDIVNRDGKSAINNMPVLLADFERKQLTQFFSGLQSSERRPPPLFSFGPPPAPPLNLIQVEEDPQLAYLIQIRPPQPHGGRNIFFITVIALSLAILTASAVCIYILFHYFSEKAQSAQTVINEIKGGNLKARFPISRLDNVGLIMKQFNIMADEIEQLVRKLEETDQRRMELLQELSHDLRTPLASLRSMVDTVVDSHAQLTEETKLELLRDCQKEIAYFGRLTEDLLFLARVSEPKYQIHIETVDIANIASTISSNLSKQGVQCEIQIQSPDQQCIIPASQILMTRLIRNACENAISFARSNVKIVLQKTNTHVVIRIEDNGPGLAPDQLENFGKKRFSRSLDPKHADRLSIGLGSVIMNSIVHVHRGTIHMQNRVDNQNRISGAALEIQLPLRAG